MLAQLVKKYKNIQRQYHQSKQVHINMKTIKQNQQMDLIMSVLIKAKGYRIETQIENRTKVEVLTCQILTLKKYSLKSMFH